MTGSKSRGVDQIDLEDLIPLSKAARITGLSHSHLRKLVRQGDVWGRKLGWGWVTTEEAVREYQARNVKPGPKPKNPLEQ